MHMVKSFAVICARSSIFGVEKEEEEEERRRGGGVLLLFIRIQ
jgi:hypothetical protein